MSIIQTIRDKGARIAVVLIALALVGFILTDYFAGKGRSAYGSGASEIVGKVNGQSIDRTEFEKKVKQQEDQQQSQGYSQGGDAGRQQATEAVWDQEVSRLIMSAEVDKLGMQIGKKELGDILYGPNAPADLQKQFTDPQTGQFNPLQAKAQIDQMLKKGTADQKESFNTYLNQLELQRKIEKYNSLLANSVNTPRWFLEKQNADNSQLAKISFVKEVYSSIPDSTVKISDDEIKDYVSKHKDDYKQEESRSIWYVAFSAAPNRSDSNDAKNKAEALKMQFDTTKDVESLLQSEGANPTYNGFISAKTIQIAAKDSIFKTPVGHVYGPYLDGGSYVLAKVLGAKPMPDTVKVRHILIATTEQDPQTGQTKQKRDTVEAKRIIDSIQTLIRNGANFDSLCAKISDDPGSKDKGGIYDNVVSGKMVPEFNNFIFGNPVGTKGIVKTDFGYHYIEILSQKGNDMGYKVAYLPKQIVVSTETDNNARNEANLFAGDSRDMKSFDANYEKNLKPKGLQKGIGTDIKPTAFEIPGLGFSRDFIKKIYKASRGEVILSEGHIGDNYVVAVVTAIYEEGTMDVAKARATAEPALRNTKKAEMLKKKIGKVTTLEAAASVLGKPIETVDSLRMTGRTNSQSLGYEPRVSGAAFNPANRGKVVPEVIEGSNGVYVVRVDNVSATVLNNANVAEQRKAMYQQGKQQAMYNTPLKALRSAATIKDKRADIL